MRENKRTESSGCEIGEFRLKSTDTVNKRKRPRAVEIKNRNAE